MTMQTSPNDVSNQEILEAMNAFASHMDSRMDNMATKQEFLQSDVSDLRSEVSDLKSEFSKLKTTVVTKGYLDDKLADLKSDLRQDTAKQIQKALN